MVAQLTPDVLKELDRTHGGPVHVEDPRTHAQYVLIAQETYQRVLPLLSSESPTNGNSNIEWSEGKNERRIDLIEKEIAGTLNLDEAAELERLQHELYVYRQRVAPLPLDDLRNLHAELLAKAAQAEGPN